MDNKSSIGIGVEIELNEPDDFLVIEETLTRIGHGSRSTKTLEQCCHILHKRDKYYIVHYNEMFLLDGDDVTLSVDDIGQRNTVARLLAEWKLLRIVGKLDLDIQVPVSSLLILPYRDKGLWKLVMKYNLGVRREARQHL